MFHEFTTSFWRKNREKNISNCSGWYRREDLLHFQENEGTFMTTQNGMEGRDTSNSLAPSQRLRMLMLTDKSCHLQYST